MMKGLSEYAKLFCGGPCLQLCYPTCVTFVRGMTSLVFDIGI